MEQKVSCTVRLDELFIRPAMEILIFFLIKIGINSRTIVIYRATYHFILTDRQFQRLKRPLEIHRPKYTPCEGFRIVFPGREMF